MDERKPENEPIQAADKTAEASSNGVKTPAVEETPSAAPKESAEKPLEQLVTELKEENVRLTEGWQRTAAEFANYRKRTDKERADTYQVAAVDSLKKLLPVVDDFDRALQAIPTDQANGLAFESLKLLHRKLNSVLDSVGIKAINPLGEKFNPDLHEAIGQDDGTGKPSGQVTVVLQKGYVYGEKLLRAALVRVAG